ncbi:MAG: protein kinase [Acidobacteria bacterium]|nr:protein kinase [Acidobacteriota bacterium]
MACPVCGSTDPARDGNCPGCGASFDGATVYPGATADGQATGDFGRQLPQPGDGATILPGTGGQTYVPAPTPRPGTSAPHAPVGHHAGPLGVGQDFGNRYHILKELGVGGMGAVYQAWDAELGVAVAVKVIRPEALKDPHEAQELERRFKRELLLARQVTHKSVVRIHDLGEIQGIKYITMSFVDGEDLATLLKRDGKVPLPRVLRIAKQVVSGMQAAHEAGVVHRDLKPANIMLDHEDNALIMDFGIALSSGKGGKDAPPAASAAPSSTPVVPPLMADATATVFAAPAAVKPDHMKASRSGTILSTKSGGIVGTLEYMAPEQSKGEAVDQRTDIYAFGLILSDLILGSRTVPEGSTPWRELTERIAKAPLPLRSREPGLPEAVDAIVTKCLQISPSERFQTTAELTAALNRLDDEGNLVPEPVVKRFTPRIAAAAAVIVAMLVGGTYWMARGPAAPPKPPDPVSVLIADFANNAQDPVFDGLIEQALAVGVEGASFVSAYPRRDAIRLAGQIKPGGHLDAPTATLVALREGVDRVITGAIDKTGSGYTLSVRVVTPSDNKVVFSSNASAAGKDAVLGAVGTMAASIRAGLGDRTATSDKAKNEETFTAASLEAARAYASGQEFQWAGKYDDALKSYQQAATLDPTMGRAYSGMGATASSLGRRQDAEEFYKQALARTGRMTDREKYRTRSGYYLLTRNTDKAREELQALLKQFPTDSAALSNLALTEFYRRDMPHALELGRKASAVFPNSVFRKNNAALYAMYAGDFPLAEKEAAGVIKLNAEFAKAYVAMGLSQLAQERPADAEQTYRKLDALTGSARWFGANGLVDLAMYQGRLADAAAILEPAIKEEKDVSRQARLIVTLADVRALQGRSALAVQLATQALAKSSDEGITFLAGRVLSEAKALELVGKLLQRLDAESLAYARVLEGEIALKTGDPRKAIQFFKTAQQFADSWLGRFGLGRAYLAAGATAEADSEFDLCLKRRGEATAVLLDDVPTFHLFAPIEYYEGRVHEALGSPDAADFYRTFIATKQNGDEQGLVADARKRLTAK